MRFAMGNEFLASRQKPQASGTALPRKRLKIAFLPMKSFAKLQRFCSAFGVPSLFLRGDEAINKKLGLI